MTPQTVGMLELKIEQLRWRLNVINEHERMSRTYPNHWANVQRKAEHLNNELQTLQQCRQSLLSRSSSTYH